MKPRAVGLAIALAACAPAATKPDASTDDASMDRKVPPTFDASDGAVTGPDKLSGTGLYADFASRTLASGVVTYEPRWPLWSDGADKKRYLLLPAGMTIDTSSIDDWAFPIGTKVWKEFSVSGTVVETRMLWKQGDAAWWEIAYAWSADGSDALAAPAGVPNALGTGHDIPSQQDCNACHGNVRDVLIGVSALQLGAKDGDGTLAKLAQMGALSNAPPASMEVPGTGTVKDALGYLHANCGHCHNDESSLRNQTQMRLRLSVSDVTPEATAVYRTAPFLKMKHIAPPDVIYALVPGQPDQSGISVRMADRSDAGSDAGDPWQMPPVCTRLVDSVGVATVRAWITAMPCGNLCLGAPAP